MLSLSRVRLFAIPCTVAHQTSLSMEFSRQEYWSGLYFLSSVQFSCSVVSNSFRPHESEHAKPSCPLPTPGVHSDSTSIESVMPSSHLTLCRPLLLLPPIPPSIRVFSNESTLHMRCPKYWSFSLPSFLPKKSQG